MKVSELKKIIKEEIDPSILENMKESEATQLKIEINVEEVDTQTDCLKFKLLQGDVCECANLLNEFDEKILS